MSFSDVNRVYVSVDCVIFGYSDQNLRVLVMESDMPEFQGQLSLVGELVKANQTLEDCALEVIRECASLKQINLEELGTYSALDRHPYDRTITVGYYSLLKIDEHNIVDIKNRGLRWVDVNEIKEMAFDHFLILNDGLKMLRRRMRESPLGFSLMPRSFTMNELQKMYESVFVRKIDKRNFRRKLLKHGMLTDLNETQKDVSHRPAKLYSFNKKIALDKKIGALV